MAPSAFRAGTLLFVMVVLSLIDPSTHRVLSSDCARLTTQRPLTLLTSRKICCPLQSELLSVISENEENTLYVAACNPVCLYFMNTAGKSGYFVDLSDIFPRMTSGFWHPFVTVAPLGSPLKGQVILHEQQVNVPRPVTQRTVPRVAGEGKGKNDSQPLTETCYSRGSRGGGLERAPGVVCQKYCEDGPMSPPLQRPQHDL